MGSPTCECRGVTPCETRTVGLSSSVPGECSMLCYSPFLRRCLDVHCLLSRSQNTTTCICDSRILGFLLQLLYSPSLRELRCACKRESQTCGAPSRAPTPILGLMRDVEAAVAKSCCPLFFIFIHFGSDPFSMVFKRCLTSTDIRIRALALQVCWGTLLGAFRSVLRCSNIVSGTPDMCY